MTFHRTWLLTITVVLLVGGLTLIAARAKRGDWRSLPAGIKVMDADWRQVSLAVLLTRGEQSALAVIRIQAAWCGTCRWHASWSGAFLREIGDRVRLIDVLVADEDNQPPSPEDLRAWRARAGAHVTVVGDTSDQFRALFPPPAPLPRVLVIDGRDLTIRASASNPDPDRLVALVARVGQGHARAAASARIDGLFTRDQWALIEGMRWTASPPPDPTNRVADDPAAAALGRTLFADATLSLAGRACASCHNPDLLFTNGKDVAAEGVGPGSRNVPTILAASGARWLLWDGRVDSLWAQAVMPIEDPEEMGSSRLFVAHAIHQRHRPAYEAVFGPLPPLEDGGRFPVEGKPGDPRWDAMEPADREAVTRVLANVGKAIAAYERSLRVQPTALDRYASGERGALTRVEQEGLAAFFEAGCAQCHYGPRLSDEAFHALRFPTGRHDGRADRGRIDGIPRLFTDELSRDGRFSDAILPPVRPRTAPSALGAFRTPSLRGVPFTRPYGHGGGFSSLTSVIDAHRTGGLPPGNRYAIGEAEPWAQGFDPQLTQKIQPFLYVLRVDVVQAAAPPPQSAAAAVARE